MECYGRNPAKLSPLDPGSPFDAGTELTILQHIARPFDVVQSLGLEGRFSPVMLKHVQRLREASFTFALDAATGYIHSHAVGSKGNYKNAMFLLEMALRDKSRYTRHKVFPCRPSLMRVETGNSSFDDEHVIALLDKVGCDLVRVPAVDEGANFLDAFLVAASGFRDEDRAGPKIVFDSYARQGNGAAALTRVSAAMVPIVNAYNHAPGPNGEASPAHKMAEMRLPPPVPRENLRHLFGFRTEAVVGDVGCVKLWGVGYYIKYPQTAGQGEHMDLFVDCHDVSEISVSPGDGMWYPARNIADLPDGYGWFRDDEEEAKERVAEMFRNIKVCEDYPFDFSDIPELENKVEA